MVATPQIAAEMSKRSETSDLKFGWSDLTASHVDKTPDQVRAGDPRPLREAPNGTDGMLRISSKQLRRPCHQMWHGRRKERTKKELQGIKIS